MPSFHPGFNPTPIKRALCFVLKKGFQVCLFHPQPLDKQKFDSAQLKPGPAGPVVGIHGKNQIEEVAQTRFPESHFIAV